MKAILARMTRRQKWLAAAAVIPALVVYWCGQVTFFIDSHTYALNGYHLFDPLSGCDYYWRTLGYPLLLSLSGVQWLKSFEGILLLQMLTAIAMPWLLYLTIKLLNERFAWWGALLFVSSLLPYLFQQTIYPDQLQAFLGFVVALCAVRVVLKAQPRDFVWLCVWVGIAMFFRPTLLALYVLIPLGLVWSLCLQPKVNAGQRQSFKNIAVLATMLIVIAQFAHSQLNDSVFRACQARDKVAIPDQYSMFGKQIFVNAYLYSYGIPDVFSARTGTATAEFAEAVYDFMQTPYMLDRIKAQQHLPKLRELAKAAPDVGTLGDYVLAHPHHDYFWLIYFTPVPDALFRDMSLELYTSHPRILGRLLWTSWKGFTFGEAGLVNDDADLRYLYLTPNFSPAWIILDDNYKILPPRLADELRGHLDYRYINLRISDFINLWWSRLFTLCAAVVMLLATGGLILLAMFACSQFLRRRFACEARVLLACELVAWVQILPIMLLTIPMFRYQTEVVLVAIPSAASAAFLLWRLWQGRRGAASGAIDNRPSAA